MKVFSESIVSEMKPVANTSSNALCTVVGPCFQFGVVNRNRRLYSKKLVEDRIINNPTVQEALKNKSMLGEGGHPESRVDISYPEVALAVEKLWIPEGGGDMLWGQFAILDTPTGRILNTLVNYGTKLGISARAVADSVQKDGNEVILENTYELITFDAVPEPGFQCARLEKVESVSKSVSDMSVKELKESSAALKSFKNPVFESRIRKLDREISRRENKTNIQAILESVDRLSATLDKSLKRVNNIKYEKKLASLIKEAKSIVSEARKMRARKNIVNESLISNKYKTSDTFVNKFDEDQQANEKFSPKVLFESKDKSALEKMCENFRRNLYE